jgi:hypothetical protein
MILSHQPDDFGSVIQFLEPRYHIDDFINCPGGQGLDGAGGAFLSSGSRIIAVPFK